MRHAVTLLSIAALATLLTACNKAGGGEGKETASATAAATTPHRKAGLWEQNTSGEGMPSVSMSMCLGPETDKALADFAGQSGAECGAGAFTKTADGMTFSNTCNMSTGGTTKTEGKITGDFNSEYTMEYHSETTGSSVAQMNGAHAMTIHAVWKGECPADMKPGDTKVNMADLKLPNGMTVKMPNGMTMNVSPK